jgi:hypothetical protein
MVKKQAIPMYWWIFSHIIWEQSWNDYKKMLTKHFIWKQSWKWMNTIMEKPMVERWGMQLNVSLNDLEKNSRSW